MFHLVANEFATGKRTEGTVPDPPPPPVDPPIDPPVTPPPTGNAVTVGANSRLVNTRLGWTSVHSQRRDATTQATLATTATIQNQHLLGFGAAVNPQPGAGAAYDWSFLDGFFGATAGTGYAGAVADELCLTACGCPPHMRVPKGTLPPDPIGPRSGAQLTSLADYSPPHSSWFQEYANLIAAFMQSHPHVKYLQVWNEMKGLYFATQYAGSSLVPPGSGLPARTGGNRWWTEGYTAMYNLIWSAVKAVRPDAFIVGPYHVLNSLAWDQSVDWTNDAFPDLFMRNTGVGAWGYGDKKVMSSIRYFIQYCRGADALCVDIRNLTKDGVVTSSYFPASVPAAADLANKWLTNPNGGTTSAYRIEGDVGAWTHGQRMVDFAQWIKDLGNSNAVYQRSVCDARTIPVVYAEWYAYSAINGKYADPHTGDFYNERVASHQEWAAAFAWQYLYAMECDTYYCMAWKPEGTVGTGGSVLNDSAESNPLALWHQYGTTKSLQETELVPVCEKLIAAFPVGAQLKTVTSTVPEIKAAATATKLMLVSRSPNPISLTADGQAVTLAGFEVRVLDRITVASNPSGFAMPTTNPAGMTRVFEDNFTTYGNIPVGSFPASTGGRWGGYAAGAVATVPPGTGTYDMSKTCSVTNGVLNIHVWDEMVGGVQKNWCAAPWPIINDNRPTGVINGHDYGSPTSNVSMRANLYYGQVEFAFRSSLAVGWKTAWLFWPDYVNPANYRENGEIDFPEGDLDGIDTIHAFMHRQDATTGGDQASRNSGKVYANNVWHKGKIVWKPNFMEFWLDDVKLGATEISRVPANPMHWVFQTEVRLSGGLPPLGSAGDVQLDWVVMWQLDGIYA